MTTPITANTTWNLDPAHVEIGFAVRHLMISTVRGRFGAATGTVTLQTDKHTARFQPTAGFQGVTSFAFTVTGSDGSAYTGQVSVLAAP